MPIVTTLSTELRVPVPTVGAIHLVTFQQVTVQKTTSIVMEHNSNWLIPTLDNSSIGLPTIMCGELVYSDRQLLFIFPTRVSLTNITLHYYYNSASDRGRPELRFYAVPDDFNVWDTPTPSARYVGIGSDPPSGKPAGRRRVSIDVNFNTMKVLM